MTRSCIRVAVLALISCIAAGSAALPCSTFMLSRDHCLLVGHNLDQEFYTPGMIHVNRRLDKKRSVSGFDLGIMNEETRVLEWVSKYGSVTFSLLGRNLPDGGINEAGLTVSEMGLGESVFPFDESLPTMLSHLWIQYQLDNYATVDEVVTHLGDINIETQSTFSPPASANYHLLVTDSSGSIAIIEFLEGGPQVYRNAAAPVPALCNAPYQDELDRLENYQGVMGWLRRNLGSGKDLRFVTCASALEDFVSSEHPDPIAYSFDLLSQLQFASTKQWSVLYDVQNRRVLFRTARGTSIRHVDFDSLDFSADATMTILEDIDVDRSGDVSSYFVDYYPEADRAIIDRFLRSLVSFVSKTEDRDQMDAYMVEHYGFDVTRYVDRALDLTKKIRYDAE